MKKKLTKKDIKELQGIMLLHLTNSCPELFSAYMDKLPDDVFDTNIKLYRGLAIATRDVQTNPYTQIFDMKFGYGCDDEQRLYSWSSDLNIAESFTTSKSHSGESHIELVLKQTCKKALSLVKLYRFLGLDENLSYYMMIKSEKEYIMSNPVVCDTSTIHFIDFVICERDYRDAFPNYTDYLDCVKRLKNEGHLKDTTLTLDIINAGKTNEYIKCVGPDYCYFKYSIDAEIVEKRYVRGQQIVSNFIEYVDGNKLVEDISITDSIRLMIQYHIDESIAWVQMYKVDGEYDNQIRTVIYEETDLSHDGIFTGTVIHDYENNRLSATIGKKKITKNIEGVRPHDCFLNIPNKVLNISQYDRFKGGAIYKHSYIGADIDCIISWFK